MAEFRFVYYKIVQMSYNQLSAFLIEATLIISSLFTFFCLTHNRSFEEEYIIVYSYS